MIIFLFGKDTFRSSRKSEEIIAEYKSNCGKGINLKIIDCEKAKAEDAQEELRNYSIFKEKRMIVLKNLFSNAREKEGYLSLLKNSRESEDLILVHERNAVPKSGSLYKFLSKSAKIQEFNLLGGKKLKDWAEKELEGNGVALSPQAVEEIISSAAGDPWRLHNEIKKVSCYFLNGNIDKNDISFLVKPNIDADIFRTIDALASKDKAKASFFIRRHIAKNDNPLYLLSMVSFQFRNLLAVKDLAEKNYAYSSLARITKLHPFVVRKSWNQARNFTLPELKKIYQKIFKIDFSIKTGKMDSAAALDFFIAEV